MTAFAGMSPPVVENYHAVRKRIHEACERSGRRPEEVRLVAVSKTVGEEPIRQLHAAGHLEFGESRLQEASPKMADLPGDILWHFIGRLQKNKVRRIVADFAFVHSVDSLKIARYMDAVAGELQQRPRVFLQVNLAGEETKGGFGVEEVEAAMPQLLAMPHLEVSGLMCIPPYTDDSGESRVYFRRLRELRDRLENASGCPLPHLSMGMSHDYPEAIEEGATLIRVGSSLFGERKNQATRENSLE
jgi:pyridoxal phosphate enzyme (YggS family)